MEQVWKRLYNNEHILVYEGFTVYNNPYGAGTSYFENGNKYQEGIFDIKGFVNGREYYPNGQLRFEGIYRINRAYGPNYPRYGCYYDQEGNEIFEGEFRIHRGGVGFPSVITPEGYTITHYNSGEIVFAMWEDVDGNPHTAQIRRKEYKDDGTNFLSKPSYEEFESLVYQEYMKNRSGVNKEEAEKTFASDEFKEMIHSEYAHYSREHDAHELSDKQFRSYAVSTTSYNLELCFG